MKARGSAFEREVVAYLKANGFPHCERTYGAGRPDDVGDIDGIVGWTIEAKAHKSIDLAAFVDEAEAEVHRGRSERGESLKPRFLARLAIAVVLPVTAAACASPGSTSSSTSSKTTWPPGVQATAKSSCVQGGVPSSVCDCAVTYLESHKTVSDSSPITAADMREALTACKNQ